MASLTRNGFPSPAPRKRSLRRGRFALGLLLVLAVLAAMRAMTIEPRRVKPFLRDDRVVVLAHQGASGHAPSNTMPAFELALQQGADILETDVHMTKDGVLVVSHDDTIDRMSNGQGWIREMTLAELRRYDFGWDFSPDGGKTYPYRGKGVQIPTLEEVFLRWPDVRVNIELKQTHPPTEETVLALVKKYGMEDKVLIGTFHTENGKRWKALAGERVATSMTMGQMIWFAVHYVPRLDWLYAPAADAFQVPTHEELGPLTVRFDTERFVNRAHGLGMKVHYWTVNDEATMRRLIELGADGLITDYPDRAMRVLQEMGRR